MNSHASETPQSLHLEFVQLWTKSASRVHGYLLVMLMSWSDADEVLQEVAATAWEKFPEFDRSRNFLAWANGIARNKALSSRHKATFSRELTEDLIEALEQDIEDENAQLEAKLAALRSCVARLREKDRELLELRYTPDLPIEAVARRTARTVAACYKAIQRIHDQLFDCISHKLNFQEPT
ncbi:sigma-70 family RNA polymerase sigma factor [Planctomicrobium sp. SH661]|uniref:sigma-70 family RNA polymerase sigma factor n=1 Tax=Planctomicrobium sp. SH661 TaxID=3448124 RepID=UPI003F5C3AC3